MSDTYNTTGTAYMWQQDFWSLEMVDLRPEYRLQEKTDPFTALRAGRARGLHRRH